MLYWKHAAAAKGYSTAPKLYHSSEAALKTPRENEDSSELLEAVEWKGSIKLVFCNISESSPEDSCVEVSFQ